MRTLVLAAALLFVLTTVAAHAAAQDPLTNDNVQKARADITAMPEKELLSFVAYLAECSDRFASSEAVRHACHAALVKYQIEFGSGRAIDQVSEGLERLAAAAITFRENGISFKPDFINAVDAELRQWAGAALKAKHTP